MKSFIEIGLLYKVWERRCVHVCVYSNDQLAYDSLTHNRAVIK